MSEEFGRRFRRYLQTRISLDDPPVILPGLVRRQARALVRRLATEGPDPGTSGPSKPGSRGPASRPPSASDRGGPAGEPPPEPASISSSPPESASVEAGTQPSVEAGTDPSVEAGTQPSVEAGTHPSVSLPSEEVERLGREATAEEISEIPDMVTLRAIAERCVRCPLHEHRRKVVFGEGDPDADVVCVGEAPGAREDETGRPFVGPAGQLLDRLLLSVGFRREEVYICNVLKSRPPNNRDPQDEEIQACAPYLLRQIDLVDPSVIVAFGAFAARTLLDVRDSLGRLRGRTHLFRGYPLVATYHPAALLRNRSWTRPSWEDLQLVRRIVDGEAGSEATEQLGLI